MLQDTRTLTFPLRGGETRAETPSLPSPQGGGISP